jgi:hypothetical protein
MSLTATQQALAAGALRIAELLGIGGEHWQVTAHDAGDGLSGPAGETLIGLWPGRVKRATSTQASPTAPGLPAGTEAWHAIGADDQVVVTPDWGVPLAVGHILTSVADESLRFRVAARIPVAGHARYLLETL